MVLTKKQINELLELLISNLEKSKIDLEEAQKSSKPVELDQQAFGRVSRIDAIQLQQMQAASVRRLQVKILQIEKALENINDPSYGECQSCEEAISYNRLKARPESPLCINCANK